MGHGLVGHNDGRTATLLRLARLTEPCTSHHCFRAWRGVGRLKEPLCWAAFKLSFCLGHAHPSVV